jgi:hypothetical protein
MPAGRPALGDFANRGCGRRAPRQGSSRFPKHGGQNAGARELPGADVHYPRPRVGPAPAGPAEMRYVLFLGSLALVALGSAPVAARAEPAGDGRIVGRLIDARTGEPVPWYELDLEDEHLQVVRVTSDGEGRFAAGAARPGPLRVSLVDCDGQATPSEHRRPLVLEPRDGEPPVDVPIDVGPTYSVDVALPEPLTPADLRVRLFLDPPEHGDESSNPLRCETLLRAPRGASSHAWARFREPNALTEVAWLQLASADGLWEGGARVPSGPGVHREPVRVELRSRCAVRGRYVFPAGVEARAFGALALFRDGAEVNGPIWAHTDGDGRFRFSGLSAGMYRLEVRDAAVRAEPVTFALRSGEQDLGELPMVPLPIVGSVRLRVQSELELPLDVQLVRTFDPPRHPPWHSDTWEPLAGGGFESRLEWDEIHAGALEVVVHTHDLGEWHLSLGVVQPPVEDLVLRLPAPRPALVLEVVDGATGAALEQWTVLVRGERGWEELDDSPESLRIAVWDADTAFAVCSPGYRAWVAGPEALESAASSDLRLVARLRRGWSHLFLARSRSRGTPLDYVDIRLDGASAGRTDARGELWVHGDAPAQELEATLAAFVDMDTYRARLDGLVSWVVLHR